LDIKRAFGQAFREARKSKGYTQEDVREFSGMSRPFLSDIENGKRQPTLSLMVQMAQAIEASPVELLARALEIAGE
jgi:transcriptional regulator with XRE-family HTH domain